MEGVYILLVNVERDIYLEIGRLGKIKFEKGNYAYVGSAQNNLGKRLERHFSSKKKIHWHIDYFLSNKSVKIGKAFFKNSGKKEECRIAKILSKNEQPIKKFGCSDCSCYSHLFRIKSLKTIKNLNMQTYFKNI